MPERSKKGRTLGNGRFVKFPKSILSTIYSSNTLPWWYRIARAERLRPAGGTFPFPYHLLHHGSPPPRKLSAPLYPARICVPACSTASHPAVARRPAVTPSMRWLVKLRRYIHAAHLRSRSHGDATLPHFLSLQSLRLPPFLPPSLTLSFSVCLYALSPLCREVAT